MEKIQKKIQKEYIGKADFMNIINADTHIVIASGSIGVYIPKENAMIDYREKLPHDITTGEILVDEELVPRNLKGKPALLTNKLAYTDKHEIARKLISKDRTLESYVLIDALKYFGQKVGYQITEKWVIAVEMGTSEIVGIILPQSVNEEEMEEYV